MTKKFSKKFRRSTPPIPINIREDAPLCLREAIVQIVYSLGYKPSFLRKIVCQVLKRLPDENNWSEHPNIYAEVNKLMKECEWVYIYDIIESLASEIHTQDNIDAFYNEVNDYFEDHGIGWKLHDGQIEFRGDPSFESVINDVADTLENKELQTAQTEIKEAIKDLSRRPSPDITGAIQHSVACLECVAREITGDKNSTLGKLIKDHPNILPKPLDKVALGIWGYSSEKGRHLKEGQNPDYAEAQLIVELSATLSKYLANKISLSD
ncbi:AbiJ-NTD4 domain-containing protein [Saprospira grandis]|uniref:Phage-related protein n=1 Tax=Saprospira grandis (strain Lewin) TaxID=984262 RepID=H6L098_SAPGL|nr:hypothetical protein [Saprospira grandis]AFC26262.1 putative phage-related protein [Saprospira grandis str. Lewin]